MYFKITILRNFVSFIIILDTFTCYFILHMIIWTLESKGKEKDSKKLRSEKVKSMPRHSGLHVTTCAEIKNWQKQVCRNHDMRKWKITVLTMPWHGMEHAATCNNIAKHGRYAATCEYQRRLCWGMRESMPRHVGRHPKSWIEYAATWVLKLKKNKEFDFN